MRNVLAALVLSLLLPLAALAQAAAPGTTDKLPFIRVDVPGKRVMVECEAVNADTPLEFLCVLAGTAEHETILRTQAKPSHIHASLLMIGMESGQPIRYSPATGQWLPPQGPPLQISVEFEKDGQKVNLPAWRLFRLSIEEADAAANLDLCRLARLRHRPVRGRHHRVRGKYRQFRPISDRCTVAGVQL